MKKLVYLPVALLMMAAVACSTSCPPENNVPVPAKPIDLTTRQGEKVAADNAFAFDLFRQMQAGPSAKENAFISPLSLTMALGMLCNGTSPDAGAEMAAALGVADFPAEEINEYYRTMRQALLAVDPLTAISIANSIWSEQSYPVRQSFIDINKTYYDAEVRSLDFTLPSTVTAINNWCAAKTNDRIKTIVDVIPANAVMYLINAVYFKGRWEMKFDKRNTENEDFTLQSGAKKTVSMMNQTAALPCCYNNKVKCLEMPYGNGAFSMLVMLPPDGSALDELIAGLDTELYGNILNGLSERNIRIKLPRFRQECEFSLKEPLAGMGMNLVFQLYGNLYGIADDPELCVSGIRQKTFVEVNEEGTEAAAVTSTEFASTGAAATFYADRPFIYLIKENSTGAILFIGRMDNPQS